MYWQIWNADRFLIDGMPPRLFEVVSTRARPSFFLNKFKKYIQKNLHVYEIKHIFF